ncbi:hypothetical protein BDZ91DRAFT_723200 [Kalaharituber pfeilii]|nr:hypothetical protein BDZ91DRAFT_723200 [Kalaharituber pfeilii]
MRLEWLINVHTGAGSVHAGVLWVRFIMLSVLSPSQEGIDSLTKLRDCVNGIRTLQRHNLLDLRLAEDTVQEARAS